MPRPTRQNKPPLTAFRIMVIMFAAGVLMALSAAGAIWLLSEDTAGLPPSADDLSTFNRLYLRAYLRINEYGLNTASAAADGVFEVREGETALVICQRLQTEGWTPSADLVSNYLVYTGGDRSIGSGMFLLRAGQSPRQIADSMASGESKVRTFTIFAGWRLEETAQALPASGIAITPTEFLVAAAARPGSGTSLDALYREIPAGATLEGFLLPGTYNVPPGESANGLVWRMAQAFQQSMPQDWITAYNAHGLTFHQAVTLASIIQREAQLEDEMPLIASVFYNRLQINNRLETDPTVQYALGFLPDRGGWWANPLLETDFQIDSPYNTFLYFGLPPGPISSPGLAALKAVAFPAESTFLFFRAACDGSGRHNFAETNLQHNAFACGGE